MLESKPIGTELVSIKPIAHFKTITRHKWYVLKYCFRAGLYWQGLTHDLSKYSPAEFLVGARYYQGDCSPNDVERLERGYSSAWLHHKACNRHHQEYWVDYILQPDGHARFGGVEMPKKYVVEMFCDRMAACRVYGGDAFDPAAPYEHYLRGKHLSLLHKNSAALLETLLLKLRDEGEDAAFDYIRNEVLKNGK